MYFHYFIIISPWKRAGPFIWINLNPLHPRMLCAKLSWNWLRGSGEEDFWISSMYFSYLVIISLGKDHGPSFTKLVSPSSMNTLFHVWLTLAYWFLRRRFLNFINVFSLFAYCIPWEKSVVRHLSNINSLHLRIFYAKFG